jgi:hypothetical protein
MLEGLTVVPDQTTRHHLHLQHLLFWCGIGSYSTPLLIVLHGRHMILGQGLRKSER